MEQKWRQCAFVCVLLWIFRFRLFQAGSNNPWYKKLFNAKSIQTVWVNDSSPLQMRLNWKHSVVRSTQRYFCPSANDPRDATLWRVPTELIRLVLQDQPTNIFEIPPLRSTITITTRWLLLVVANSDRILLLNQNESNPTVYEGGGNRPALQPVWGGLLN